MSSPEFLFYQQLPPTIINIIGQLISQGNLEQVEKLLAGKPPAVMAEFNAWKRSTDCFMDVLPAGIRNIVNNLIQNSDWAALTHLIHSSRNEAAITEFERWAARNNITLPSANGQHSVNLKESTNILLLGASGVGKSTFLNSIANYFAFGENYMEAKKSMTCTIVMEYTKYDDKKTPFNVVLPPSKNDDVANEHRVKGGSCTIDPRCYSFKYAVKGKEKYIRIIDTPGFLDYKPVFQDDDNLKKILSYLKRFQDLHAICILMKPREVVLTVPFNYFISELLSRLHKDAANNIVYFFTNTQGTHFTPGDTLGVLNRVLSKLQQENGVEMKLDRDNIFCFDNDGFRYFAAQKFAKFPVTGEEATAQENWVESARETERFLQVVANLPSYEVGKSLAIHQARDTLTSLAEPMEEKAKKISLNKREIEQKIAEINRLNQERTVQAVDVVAQQDMDKKEAQRLAAALDVVQRLENENLKLDSTLQMLRQQSAAFAAFVRKHSLVEGRELYRASDTASDSLTFENLNEKLEELLNDPDLGIYLSSIKEFLEDTPDSSELDKGCKNLDRLFGKMTV